jgi:hypothetical protein
MSSYLKLACQEALERVLKEPQSGIGLRLPQGRAKTSTGFSTVSESVYLLLSILPLLASNLRALPINLLSRSFSELTII